VQHDPIETATRPGDSGRRHQAAHFSEPVISVELTTPQRLATMEREWRDLVGRALADNAFLEPAVIAAAAVAGPTTIHVLLVWSAPSPNEQSRLIGLWALAHRRASALLRFPILKAPAHDHAFLGTPVLDRDAAGEALSNMLDAIAGNPSLPNILRIESLDAAGPIAAVFADVLARRRSPSAYLETRLRPALLKSQPDDGASSVSASRAKALRKRRRRLVSQGVVNYTQHENSDDIGQAVEEFLALEASGWKNQWSARGQAILRFPSVTTFFRTAIAALAARRLVRITALRLDGRAIAMQLTIHSGNTAFTWKTAYDEKLSTFAPGLLLHQEMTARLLADLELSVVDSCSRDDIGYMAEFWAGRRAVSDLFIDVRPHRTVLFGLISGAETMRRRLMDAARQGRSLLLTARQHATVSALASGRGVGGKQ